MAKRLLWFLLVTTMLIGPTCVFVGAEDPAAKADAAEDEPPELTPEELTKEYDRLRQERYYRHSSYLYDYVIRFSNADVESMSRREKFLHAFYDGRWDEIRRVLDLLPEKLANPIFDKMLRDLTDRYTPILTLDDFFGFADASPTELNSDRIRRLGLLLRIVVAKEQAPWLKRALEKGSRHLGKDEHKRLNTGRVLIHGEFDDLARDYLPEPIEASRIEDAAIRKEVLDYWASQELLEDFQQTRIAGLWEQPADVLSNESASQDHRRRAAEQLAELLGKAPMAMLEPWIAELMRVRPAGGLELVSVFGKNAQNQINSSDTALRINNLRAQKAILRLASERTDISQPPWLPISIAMADWWIREAQHTFDNAPSYRPNSRRRPYVVPAELLDTVPTDAWRKTLPAAHQERIDVCLSRAVLVSDRYEEAVAMVAGLADRNPDAGVTLAEEYLKAWAHRHDPHVPEAIRRKLKLSSDAHIVVTPIMMEKNIGDLAAMMDVFREHHIQPRNGEVLVDAFDVCYSNAEVYRRGHIEKVFGSVDSMNEDILHRMLLAMTEGLASRWRNLEIQEKTGTRRTEAETLEMVRRGYETALDLVDERVAARPKSWRILTLGGSLLADWGDFEYYQQLVTAVGSDRMEAYQERNHRAAEYFRRAAETYGEQVTEMGRARYSIEPYLAWFHALLGIGVNGQMNVSKPLDRNALSEIRELVRGLPEDAAKTHIDRIARHVTARLEDVENPLHEDLKYKYLAGSLVITRESPFSFQAADKVNYYDELLDEIRLETRVDGPNTIWRDHDFGIVLSVNHTEAMGRMADFGRYLVNDVPPQYAPSQSSQRQPVTVYRMGQIQGHRDILEMNIREALSLFFDVRSIAFSPRDVQPRALEQPGWQETVLAYIHCRAKDASVDKIPRIQMSLEFLDLTGPVTISAESPETMIKVTDEMTPPRPFDQVDLTVVVDDRHLETNEEIFLEISATGNGLVPDLGDLVDLDVLGQQLPVTNVDPHQGLILRSVASWAERVHAVSECQWTVVLDGVSLVQPPRKIALALPGPLVDTVSVKCQAYEDMDLLDLAEPVIHVGLGEGEVVAIADVEIAVPWWVYAVVGSTAVVVVALLLLLLRAFARRERPLRARDVFRMPEQVDGFTVIRLLRALRDSPLVRLSDARRSDLQKDIEGVQANCFNESDQTLPEVELRGVARRWLKIAC